MGNILETVANFLAADIRVATPLLLAALGLVFSERAGLVNIGTEGIMLSGACLGCLGSLIFGSSIAGTLFAVMGGAILGLIFAYFTISLHSNQTVVGLSLNLIASGLTVTLNRLFLNSAKITPYPIVEIPLLSKIPYLSDILFKWQLPVYLAFILVPVCHFVLYKTNIGLKIRAVGEQPKACDTVGINVFKVRYGTVIFSGMMSGLAGSFISMGLLSSFGEDMVAGRGFMALAVCVFGNYSPIGVMMAALVFGAASAASLRIPTNIIPYQFIDMLPYIITIIALCAFSKKSNKPKYSAVPYRKE